MDFKDLDRINEKLKTIDVKGKAYVEVNQRVMAFRELYPEGSISTDIVDMGNGVVTIKATISDADGRILATGMAYEKEGSTFINKTSYIENCETSAVGRALGFVGIGIDGSIASYEEVENAKAQQAQQRPNKTQKKTAEELSQMKPNDKVTPGGADFVRNLCKEVGSEERAVCDYFHVNNFEEMTVSEMEKACAMLEKKKK